MQIALLCFKMKTSGFSKKSFNKHLIFVKYFSYHTNLWIPQHLLKSLKILTTSQNNFIMNLVYAVQNIVYG